MSDITSTIARPIPKRLRIRRGRLTVVSGADVGRSWEVDSDVLRIGTNLANEVVLQDGTVSRRHAEVVRTPHGVILRDSNSTNGTFVGDLRIREVFLTPETRFRVGQTQMVFTPQDQVIDIKPSDKSRLAGLVGESVAMRQVFSIVERVAPTALTALVTGETGTGKELVSRAVHELSKRSDGPFRVFDCGAAPESLIESELFGHEKGAFTGAVASREGVFEAADGGTVFLDEIGELPLDLQPKLLRVLEQREVRRVGGSRVRSVDVRVVAATNRNLLDEVRAGRFREDLYYRLAVVELHLPPLRDRSEDIPLLVAHLLHKAQKGGKQRVRAVEDSVIEVFQAWRWPGNVRELANVVERAIPFTDGPIITLEALPDALLTGGSGPRSSAQPGMAAPDTSVPFKDAKEALIEAFERKYLQDLIERHDGNVSQAARAAHMDRKSIARLLRKHGIR
ncbi:MAG: sigma 54-interacting transcriptional regulator [Myxococcota bacterium]|nr:sigma 54-interacting transcriptional regulator [Myxococcota bacterium]